MILNYLSYNLHRKNIHKKNEMLLNVFCASTSAMSQDSLNASTKAEKKKTQTVDAKGTSEIL